MPHVEALASRLVGQLEDLSSQFDAALADGHVTPAEAQRLVRHARVILHNACEHQRGLSAVIHELRTGHKPRDYRPLTWLAVADDPRPAA